MYSDHRVMKTVLSLCHIVFASLVLACQATAQNLIQGNSSQKNATVLILGGGVAGVIAARTLHEQGINDFIIVEAREELGGRLINLNFGAPGRNYSVEVGAGWIKGTQSGNGPANPIWKLAKKHNLTTQTSDWYGSITTYDYNGYNDYLDVFNNAVDAYTNVTIAAGERVQQQAVDLTLQTGYSLLGSAAHTPQESASIYYQTDLQYVQSLAETSWIASSWRHNFTYNPAAGGFSNVNEMCVDQRGFSSIIQEEAKEFLQPNQQLTNHTIGTIVYNEQGVTVTTTNGTTLSADYALCTFSLGVLQHYDVKFEPSLPSWKMEAIQSMTMASYTKILLQFPNNFWFDTQMAIYADRLRGRFPVWQNFDIEGFLPGSGIIVATATGDYSLQLESLTNAEVQANVMKVLQAMYPNVTIPDPLDFHFTRWNSDPIYRGSFATWPAAFIPGHSQNLKATVSDRLWFAGEATSLKYFGTLQGAYFEGASVAEAMSSCIRGGDQCEGLRHTNTVVNAEPYSI
ncbi:amine oxidase [Hygrophoropsis aurantiaca]|uniref:Amine oxidase n=1 Tax=Hygrophoropsis aurantiaca TaxID=72124 RepID=A0ACB8AJK1_9AGAM|nr:amine oxidase [Hygrophoropsis aurantiaca]